MDTMLYHCIRAGRISFFFLLFFFGRFLRSCEQLRCQHGAHVLVDERRFLCRILPAVPRSCIIDFATACLSVECTALYRNLEIRPYNPLISFPFPFLLDLYAMQCEEAYKVLVKGLVIVEGQESATYALAYACPASV